MADRVLRFAWNVPMDRNAPPRLLFRRPCNSAGAGKAFVGGHPVVIQRLVPGTKLFKWSSITTRDGVSPWWQLLLAQDLANRERCPGIRELQTYAGRLGVHGRDYDRVRMAVTKQWNRMTTCVALELLRAQWGYIGKAAGQRIDKDDFSVLYHRRE